VAYALAWFLDYKGKTPLNQSTKPKVTFITSSMNLGGAERQLLLICNELKSIYDVEIITLDADGPLIDRYELDWPNLKIIDSRKHSTIVLLFKIFRQIGNSRPDVVVTWLYKADLLGGIACKLRGNIPVIWSARNSSIPNFKRYKRWALVFFSRIIPTYIIANGSPAIDFHKSIGYPEGKIKRIPNLISPWATQTLSRSRLLKLERPFNEIRIGIAARQVSGKGIIETITSLGKADLSIRLLLIGQKTSESELWAEAGLYRDIQVREINDEEVLSDWFTDLDIYLMSSTSWESQPNSLLEAISIGCPVIVSDAIELEIPIPKEWTFTFKEEGSLERAILSLIELNPDTLEKLILEIQAKVRREFCSQNCIAEWMSLLKGILQKP
jgi:glycosyltransferase involved in cell wall biosynthesis